MVYMLTLGDIGGILMVNVTIYSIHGSYGYNWVYIFFSEMIQKFGTAANQSHPPFIFTHGNRRVPVVASSHRGDRGDYGNGGTPTCFSWKIP